MEHLTSNLLIYGNRPEDDILMQVAGICRDARRADASADDLIRRCYAQVKRILEVGTDYGFDTNLWQNYLTFLLVTDENPFALTCEKIGARNGSVDCFVKRDFEIFLEMFHYDFSWLEQKLGIDCFSRLCDYQAIEKSELSYNRSVSERVRNLSTKLAAAPDANAFFELVSGFYRDYGVGMFGLNKAFRIRSKAEDEVIFFPINNMDQVVLDDLVGYELQKERLIANTRAFVEGRRANNCLLYGDSGTGKSTCVKAIVNEFYPQGLRMIEIYKHQFRDLGAVIAKIKNRNYRFIIYMDDLSFEEFETEYKFLKAVIEGGVETRPENILIYATSNRRHIIKETWADREDVVTDAGIHKSDTMEEKLSLVQRFGEMIQFSKPDKKTYEEIVIGLARRNGIDLPKEELLAGAHRFEMHRGGRSGRTAQQYINGLLGGTAPV